MKISTDKLKFLPKGTVFYEDSISRIVYIFIEENKKKNDVVVRQISWGGESSKSVNLGVSEMEDKEKMSKMWIVPEEEELADMQEAMAIGVYAKRDFDKIQHIFLK